MGLQGANRSVKYMHTVPMVMTGYVTNASRVCEVPVVVRNMRKSQCYASVRCTKSMNTKERWNYAGLWCERAYCTFSVTLCISMNGRGPAFDKRSQSSDDRQANFRDVRQQGKDGRESEPLDLWPGRAGFELRSSAEVHPAAYGLSGIED